MTFKRVKIERKSSLRVKFFVKFSFITNRLLSHTDSFFIAEKKIKKESVESVKRKERERERNSFHCSFSTFRYV